MPILLSALTIKRYNALIVYKAELFRHISCNSLPQSVVEKKKFKKNH